MTKNRNECAVVKRKDGNYVSGITSLFVFHLKRKTRKKTMKNTIENRGIIVMRIDGVAVYGQVYVFSQMQKKKTNNKTKTSHKTKTNKITKKTHKNGRHKKEQMRSSQENKWI